MKTSKMLGCAWCARVVRVVRARGGRWPRRGHLDTCVFDVNLVLKFTAKFTAEFGKFTIILRRNLDCRCLYFPVPEIETPHRAQGVAARKGGAALRGTQHQPDKKLIKKNIFGAGDEGEGPTVLVTPEGCSSVTMDP